MTPTETQHPATGIHLEPYCTVCGVAAEPALPPAYIKHVDPAADAECTVELGWRPRDHAGVTP